MNLHLKKITHSVPARGALASAVMRVAAALAVAFSLVACASAGPSNCDPSYECAFEYTTPDGSKSYKFDFSSLCGRTDYTLTDQTGHTYYAQICGQAQHSCLPGTYCVQQPGSGMPCRCDLLCPAASWENTYEYGVAIQMWGATPQCKSPPSCKNKDGSAACCTADCQVLGTGAPKWSLIDPANPATGGVQARYRAGASNSGPFVCKFDPATGTQYEREVTFRFLCDPEVKGVETLSALQNATDDCRYSLLFKTSKACAGDSHLRFVSRAKGRLAGLFV